MRVCSEINEGRFYLVETSALRIIQGVWVKFRFELQFRINRFAHTNWRYIVVEEL